MYVDGDHDLDFAMTFDEETGITHISANPNGSYGTTAHGTTYVGWSGETDITYIQPLLKPTDHGKPGINWQLLTATEYAVYQATIAEALSARQAMWPLLQNALATEFDCTEAWEVYRDIKSTAAQITAAHNALLTAFTAYVAANASETNPIEISYLIDHAGCGSDSFAGWTLTGTWGSNGTYFRNGDAVMQGRFTESWVQGPATLDDRALSQTVANLPAGKYQASVDVIATQQDNAALAIQGISLKLDDESVNCSTANGVPQCVTTPAITVAEGGSATISLTVSGTNANWVAFDNFRLFYLGSKLAGDVDGDGSLSFADVLAVVNIVLGKDNSNNPVYDHSIADVNSDGNVTIADVTALVNKLLGED